MRKAAATDHDPGDAQPPVDLAVVQWRYDRLLAAGYPPNTAILLAEYPTVDLHQAVGLLERGCTLRQALRILL
jgi:hypothetical protein